MSRLRIGSRRDTQRIRRVGGMSWEGKASIALMVWSVTFFAVPSIANADTAATINQTIELFNAKDSHGVSLSQFQLSMNGGSPLKDPQLMPLAAVMGITWSCYVWWVGLVGWVADWTMQMDWVPYVAQPLVEASQRIHDSILTPLHLTDLAAQGVMGLLLAIAAAAGAMRIHRGEGVGAGLMSWAASGLAAALAVGTFALPMASLVGTQAGLAKPLVYARGLSIQAAAIVEGKSYDLYGGQYDVMVPGKNQPKQDKTVHVLQQIPDDLKVSTMLVDLLVRPAHQEVNFGADIDSAKCSGGGSAADAYNTAMEKGPYWSLNPDQQRKDVGGCNAAWKKYADNPSWTWIGTALIYSIAGIVLGALVIYFVYVACRCVLTVMWSAFKLTYLSLMAIVSPGAWTGLFDALLDLAVALFILVSNMVVFCVVLMSARYMLTAESFPMPVRFLAVDIVLGLGIGLIAVNYFQTLRGKQTLMDKISARFGMKEHTKVDWAGIGRDAALGYTAISELQEKKRILQGRQEAREVEGSPGQKRVADRALERTGKSVRDAKTAVGAAAAPAATAGRAALGVAKKKVVQAKDGYQAVTEGAEVSGAGKVVLPVAKGHVALRNRRTEALNKISSAKLSLVDQHDVARSDGTTSVVGSGFNTADRLAIKVGQKRRVVDQASANARDVMTSKRHPNRRGEQATSTGNKTADAALRGAGQALRGVDRATDAYQRPASVQPRVERKTTQDLRNTAPRAARPNEAPVTPTRATPTSEQRRLARERLNQLREQTPDPAMSGQ